MNKYLFLLVIFATTVAISYIATSRLNENNPESKLENKIIEPEHFDDQSSRLEFPVLVELGELPVSSRAVAEFSIANRADEDISIFRFKTACSCMGVEFQKGDIWEPVNSVKIPAKSVFKFRLRFSVVGNFGQPMQTSIQFETNEPTQKSAEVIVKVSKVIAGMTSVPPVIVLSDLRNGVSSKHRFEIRDGYPIPRKVGRVEYAGMPNVECKYSPIDNPKVDKNQHGTLVGYLDCKITPESSGHQLGLISIFIEGEEATPSIIPINFSISEDVRILPQKFYFPKMTDEGLLFKGTLLVSSDELEKYSIEYLDVPREIEIKPQDKVAGATSRKIEISVKKEYTKAVEEKVYKFEVQVSKEKKSQRKEITITVSPKAP
ncbi:hypothetical protein KIH39_13675 [Telmatocola sphagniphila]|uniref:DUF1573 domain-containing protein n=1 Tax=Telmatocola sphagniphila TaxID=1123043 RepID=A0A8E6B285_9BACT|nr:hypothetical protein [Telmatocola sphagniphila]QVL29919.1 hypothetical protein KIH39_13675 [Telmatocola sphagniphila]